MCDQHRFRFHLSRAYSEQAVEQFEASPPHPLSAHQAPREFGVYALYQGRSRRAPVYVGKALNTTLARRLTEHAKKVGSRQGLRLDDMWCRYLVMDRTDEAWVAASAEAALITHYKPQWQKSGFGSHIPGAGRPGIKTSRWDTDYPPLNAEQSRRR
jgi:hypothetical protein